MSIPRYSSRSISDNLTKMTPAYPPPPLCSVRRGVASMGVSPNLGKHKSKLSAAAVTDCIPRCFWKDNRTTLFSVSAFLIRLEKSGACALSRQYIYLSPPIPPSPSSSDLLHPPTPVPIYRCLLQTAQAIGKFDAFVWGGWVGVMGEGRHISILPSTPRPKQVWLPQLGILVSSMDEENYKSIRTSKAFFLPSLQNSCGLLAVETLPLYIVCSFAIFRVVRVTTASGFKLALHTYVPET